MTGTILLADDPDHCPICGSPPNRVDVIEVGDDRHGVRYVPTVYHCPNETRFDHLPQPRNP